MTERTLRANLAWMYRHGMKEIEICERLRTSMIWTRHAVARLLAQDPQLQGDHLRNRRARKKWPRAQFVLDDPMCEQEDKYSDMLLERLSCAGVVEAWNK